jgi:hypothetical protein
MKPRTTEAEWLAAKDPIDLDLYRSAWKQFRKWRLYAVACCRCALTLAPDARLDELAATAERFADELVTWDEMKRARRVLTVYRKELGEQFGPDEVKHRVCAAFDLATAKEPITALGADEDVASAFAAVARPKFDVGMRKGEKECVRVARDIFGNPFRPVAFADEWRTSTAVAVAQQMYDSRDFGAMPILADALQDTGCEDEAMLNHCRDAKQAHVRGCWVVDLVLGKK